jgi:hypothetical protein
LQNKKAGWPSIYSLHCSANHKEDDDGDAADGNAIRMFAKARKAGAGLVKPDISLILKCCCDVEQRRNRQHQNHDKEHCQALAPQTLAILAGGKLNLYKGRRTGHNTP